MKYKLGQRFLNRWQMISYAIMTSKRYTNYIDRLDYDGFDWYEWGEIHRN